MRQNFLNNYVVWGWCKHAALRMSVLWWFWLLGGCATIDPFANLDEWKEIQSKNFIVYTNAQEKVALNFVKEFEVFRATALKITTIPPFEETVPVRARPSGSYSSRHSLADFNSALTNGSSDSSGMVRIYSAFIH